MILRVMRIFTFVFSGGGRGVVGERAMDVMMMMRAAEASAFQYAITPAPLFV